MPPKIISEIRSEPLVLSHHPLCGRYEDHFIHFRGRKLCRGCFTVYPTALAIILFLLITDSTAFWPLAYIALLAFSINLYRFVLKTNGALKVGLNVLLGISLGATLLSLLFAPGDIMLPWTLFVLAVSTVFIVVKAKKAFSRCKGCDLHRSFPRCASPPPDMGSAKPADSNK